MTVFEKWMNLLKYDYALFFDGVNKNTNRNGNLYIKNDCERIFLLDSTDEIESKKGKKPRFYKRMLSEKNKHGKSIKRLSNKATRQLSSFLLQGKESYFIHSLTDLVVKSGNTVVQNEFDGIITKYPIDPALIEKAKTLTQMLYVKLELKPLSEDY